MIVADTISLVRWIEANTVTINHTPKKVRIIWYAEYGAVEAEGSSLLETVQAVLRLAEERQKP